MIDLLLSLLVLIVSISLILDVCNIPGHCLILFSQTKNYVIIGLLTVKSN